MTATRAGSAVCSRDPRVPDGFRLITCYIQCVSNGMTYIAGGLSDTSVLTDPIVQTH